MATESWIFYFSWQIQTVAKTAGTHHDEWVENADRWVVGFLEMFEEGCHKMVCQSIRMDLFLSALEISKCFHICQLMSPVECFSGNSYQRWDPAKAIEARVRREPALERPVKCQGGTDF